MAFPPIFDPIVNAPKPRKIVAGVMGLLIIGAAGYFLLLSPVQAQVAQLRAQLDSLQHEVARSRAIVADLLKYRREAAELEARLNALKEKLPGEREIPPLYRALSDAAAAARLGGCGFPPHGPRRRRDRAGLPHPLKRPRRSRLASSRSCPPKPALRSRSTSRKDAAIPSRPSWYGRAQEG